MKPLFFVTLFCLTVVFKLTVTAQNDDTTWKHIYRATETKLNDLVHTKLDVRFDYDKSYLYGKAWVTLKPHAYATDSLRLEDSSLRLTDFTPSAITSRRVT